MSGQERREVRIRCDTCKQAATPWLPPEQAVALIAAEGWATVGHEVFGAHACAECRRARKEREVAARR